MNETRNNISKKAAMTQMEKDRDTILFGAVNAFAEKNKLRIEDVQVVETVVKKRTWYGAIKSIETTFSFKGK